MSITIPAARPVVWPLRPAESAEVTQTRADGRTVVTIAHAPLAGVTPEMLAWWFRHVPGTMSYAGATWPRYLVWHPLDHVSYDVERSATADEATVRSGDRLHIVEALARRQDSVLDLHVDVQRMEEHSAVIGRRVLGSSVVRLENEFEAGPSGARYVTRMTLGDTSGPTRLLLNRVAHTKAMPPAKLDRWIPHHIEEIGNLENFLPDLFRERAELEA